ncbi:MAG: ABC transporter ATP-binding protein [Dehalococcoidia bacterium]
MTSPSKADLLEVRALEVRYGPVRAVTGATFSVREGEIVALLGSSGCGKTTLLRAIAGFERASAGEVLLDSTVIESATAHRPAHRRNIGMVFQEYALFPHRTVEQNIAYGLQQGPFGGMRRGKNATERVAQLLRMAGLEEFAGRYPHQLSGGQQQRVAVLRSLAPKPRLLLLDEPFSNLDPALRHEMREQVGLLLRAEGVSAVLVTHDRSEAMGLADRVAVMRDGAILQCDTPEELYFGPVTPAAAALSGEVQYFDGMAASGAALTALGLLRLRRPIADGPCRVLVRPDWIVPCADGARAMVMERRVEGALTRLRVELESGLAVSVAAPSGWLAQLGETVRLGVTVAVPAFVAEEASPGSEILAGD